VTWESGHLNNIFQAKSIGVGGQAVVTAAADGQVRHVHGASYHAMRLDSGPAGPCPQPRGHTALTTSHRLLVPCGLVQFP
jgi:hypothetical protein